MEGAEVKAGLWGPPRGRRTEGRGCRGHPEPGLSQRWAGAASPATGPRTPASGTQQLPFPALLLLWRGGQGGGQCGEGASDPDQRGGSVA